MDADDVFLGTEAEELGAEAEAALGGDVEGGEEEGEDGTEGLGPKAQASEGQLGRFSQWGSTREGQLARVQCQSVRVK